MPVHASQVTRDEAHHAQLMTQVWQHATGGLLNWRVWYLGLVWLLMESALFGIIFWWAMQLTQQVPLRV